MNFISYNFRLIIILEYNLQFLTFFSVYLIYNVILVSCVPLSDPVIHVYIYSFQIVSHGDDYRVLNLFPSTILRTLLIICFIYSCVHMLIPNPDLSLPDMFPLW